MQNAQVGKERAELIERRLREAEVEPERILGSVCVRKRARRGGNSEGKRRMMNSFSGTS